MAETIKIGGELESNATGNKVVDVANIKDKTQGDKSQAQINADINTALDNRYIKSETYTKTEVDELVSALTSEKYVTLEAEDGDTLADVFDGVTGATDTLYRVAKWDGSVQGYNITVYSEYYYDTNSEAFKCLNVKNYGIDNEPIAGSNNLVKSGGVFNTPKIMNCYADSDLDISDEDGYVLVRFKDGHFQTKNFDSSKIETETDDNTDADLDIADINGYVLARFKDGHFQTKNFDSSKITLFSEIENAVQVNDGFIATSASDAQMVLDDKYGFVFLSYSTAFGSYGEAHDSLMMSIFPLGQPLKYKSILIGNNGETSSNLISLGNGSVRVIYSTAYYNGTYYYKDYIFTPETKEWHWTEAQKIKMYNSENVLVDVTRNNANSYIMSKGYSVDGANNEIHIVGEIKKYGNYHYGTITGLNIRPILWYSDDNCATIHPFEVFNQIGVFEADVAIFDSKLCVVNRLNNSVSYAYATYDEVNHTVGQWSEFKTLKSSKGSRPQISIYKENLIIAYTISGISTNDFPKIQDDRTGMCLLISPNIELTQTESYVWKSKYGIIYPRFFINYDDIYLSWSDSRIGLLNKNTGNQTIQGKETIRFTKIV